MSTITPPDHSGAQPKAFNIPPPSYRGIRQVSDRLQQDYMSLYKNGTERPMTPDKSREALVTFAQKIADTPADQLSRMAWLGSEIKPIVDDYLSLVNEEGSGGTTRDLRQRKVADWCAVAFGSDHAASIPQRGIRHVEEAIEASQAAGCERDMIHKLVDYVFDRPAGELWQELGGSGLTLLALAQAAGVSADECETAEIARVLAKPLEHFTKRNQSKNDAGFVVTPTAATAPQGEATFGGYSSIGAYIDGETTDD